MLQVINHTETCRCFRCVRTRLTRPPNAVVDHGIDLKRPRKLVPITDSGVAEPVPIRAQEFDMLEDGCLDNIIEAFIPVHNPSVIYRTTPRLDDIITVVSEFYLVEPLEIISARRTKEAALARQIVSYLAKTLTPLSYPQIGRGLGNRDHSTIIHAFRKIKSLLPMSERLRDEIDLLKIKLSELVRHRYINRGVLDDPPTRKPYSWSPEKVAMLQHFLTEKTSRKEMAKHFNVTASAINNTVRRYNLKRPK